MSINDISTCLEGGRSCGVGREEEASNLLWCEHCGIASCFDCDTDLHNSKHGHLRVLLPASKTAAVRKCEHGADGSSNFVRLGLNLKPSPSKNKRRVSKQKEKISPSKNSDPGRRLSSSRNDGGDGTVKLSETPEFSSFQTLEKAPSSLYLRSALRGGYEKAGLGPRPKRHVTWHSDVKEPICTLVSHTVGHKRAPFLSRRSHQKQLRQKSKASSKSQARAKKLESNKHKKSEPVKARADVISDFVEKPVADLRSSDIAGTQNFTNPTWSDCTYCIQEERLCDCVNMSEGSISNPYLQSILLESAVHPESLVNKSVEDVKVNVVDKKASAFETDDGCLDESFPEDYRQLLASMFHAATSLGQNKILGSNVNYEAASRLFRDVKLHAPGASSEQVFKQATQGKISPWISVV